MRASTFGILLQSANLFQHLTVAQNVELAMQIAGKADAGRVVSLLQTVGLDHRADSYPAMLSGGETARAGLAAALGADPPVLIADEPTAEVDGKTERRLIWHFEARRGEGKATLIATHSMRLAQSADRIIHLRDGKIVDG
jgi:putative ABC transport system ATP-binding protein